MRKQALLTMLGFCCSVLLAAGQDPPLAVSSPDHSVHQVVFPTGEYPLDLDNVQAAVDQGGTVRLMANNELGQPADFNFGEPQETGVSMTRDVAILGERHGSRMTTIRGGFVPFRGFGPAIRTRIEGINFERPLLSAILITRSMSSQIVGNRVAAVAGLYLPFLDLYEGRAIKFLANDDPEGGITGRVRVAHNLFEDMHADFSDAIVFDEVAADLEITGNRIETVQSSGILVIRSAGRVRITDNLVVPGLGDPGEYSFGNGMSIFGSRGARYHVARNMVLCENPEADGILFLGTANIGTIEGAVVEANRVVMRGSVYGALTMAGAVTNAEVKNNRLEGDGAFGLYVGEAFSPDDLAVSNTLRGNRVSDFSASVADAYFGTNAQNNRLRGHCGTVLDLGQGNDIDCHDHLGPGEPVGQRIERGRATERKAWAAMLAVRSAGNAPE